MGELIRDTDWSKTPIGEPDTWPQPLKTMVSVMLNNPFGMYIAWGKEYIQLYNNGYRPILGTTKHPQAVGISSKKTFSEIWDVIGDMFENVMKGTPIGFPDLKLMLNRNGFLEACYFNFSYSPIYLENGEVGGVLVTVIETTNKKKAEDALIESKEQLEFAIEAADLATWDYRPITGKFTASSRLKDWFGLHVDGEIDLQDAINSINDADRERVATAINNALDPAGDGQYDIEYGITNPIKKITRIVRARGMAWFGDDKVAYRLNGTLQDVTREATARIKIEAAEMRLRLAVDSARLGTYELDLRNGNNIYSQQTYEIFGLDPQGTWTHEDLKNALHPEDMLVRDYAYEAALANGLLLYEARIIWQDGSTHWIRNRATVTYENQVPVRMYGTILDITDEKESEKKLKLAKEQLELIFNNVPASVQLRDKKGRLLYINDQAAALTGFKNAGEMIEQGDLESVFNKVSETLDILDEAGKPLAFENSPTAVTLKTGKPVEGVYSFVKKNSGESLWVLSKSSALFDEYGEVSMVISTSIDITQQKNSEIKIKESEERFRNLADQAPLWVWMVAENLEVEYANNVLLRFFGLNHYSDLTAPTWEKFVHPDDLESVYEILGKAAAGSVSLEYRVKNISSGAYEWMLMHAVPRIIDKKFSGFIGTCVNINESKLAMQQLSESEVRFRLLADSMPQFVWSGDAEGNLNYFNQSVFNYSGLSPEYVFEHGWLQIVHPDEQEENIKQWLHAIKTGTDFNFEHRFKRYDGQYRWQLSRAVPQRGADGNIQIWVGTSTDIQEIKEHDQQKDYFISSASHEMKTPLTTVKGYLDLLLLSLQDKEHSSYLYASRASKGLNKLEKLIAELLDMSKMHNGKLNYNVIDFDFDETLAQTIENAKHITNKHEIIKDSNCSLQLRADKDRVEQVLINLLTNAIKYSPTGGKVIVRAEAKNGYLEVSVKDFGIGMLPDHVDKIFQRYYRVKEHEGHFQGLGIGLFICSEIIKSHNGKIWAESETGKGSTFHFTLPLHQEQ